MTTHNNQRVYLDDLAKRWQMSTDQILEMTISGKIALWLHFSNVFLQKPGKAGSGGKKKMSTPQLHDQAEVKPRAEVLTQVLGRCDRMLIGAEFPCLDANNKAVMVSNSVGEEWGETSMIGLKPNNLFALLDDVVRFERKQGIGQPAEPVEERVESLSSERSVHSKDHPCFALELHAACSCWEALFAQATTTDPAVKKADILAWLQQQHPELSKAAAERIALVVTPAKGSCR